MGLPNWFGLSKDATDPQTIGEAIAEGIDNHNADTEAHLAVDEAIETHRANLVIDHPAESVVNDKLQITARRYTAVVDPTDDEAYDTIQGAIAYVIGIGKGDIFIATGEHYFTGDMYIPPNISITGAGKEETFLYSTTEATDQIILWNSAENIDYAGVEQVIEGITFGKAGNDVKFGYSNAQSTVQFNSCTFDYIRDDIELPEFNTVVLHQFNRCVFNLRASQIKTWFYLVELLNCTVKRIDMTGDIFFFEESRIVNTEMRNAGAPGTVKWFNGGITNTVIDNCRITSMNGVIQGDPGLTSQDYFVITNSVLQPYTGKRIDVIIDNAIIMGCKLGYSGGAVPRLNTLSDNCIATNNLTYGVMTDSGTNNLLANNLSI